MVRTGTVTATAIVISRFIELFGVTSSAGRNGVEVSFAVEDDNDWSDGDEAFTTPGAIGVAVAFPDAAI